MSNSFGVAIEVVQLPGGIFSKVQEVQEMGVEIEGRALKNTRLTNNKVLQIE